MGWLSLLFGERGRVLQFRRSHPISKELWQRALAKASESARPCWFPTVVDQDGPVTASKFGGTPWLHSDESWPRCGCCGVPLQPFVQLNAASLPSEAPRVFDGVLQLFYCVNNSCEPSAEDWNGFGRNQLVRIVKAQIDATGRPSPLSKPFPGRCITGWNMVADFPASGEVSDNWPEGLDHAFYEHAHEFDHVGGPAQCDKLFGWPDWIQGMEYVPCPDCGKPMTYVFQLASEDHIPFMFGDAGNGHISICPDHPNRVAFRWACC